MSQPKQKRNIEGLQVANGKDDITAWIAAGLAKPGKSRSGLARALDLHPSQITKLMAGKRHIKTDEVPIIAAYLGESSPGSRQIAHRADEESVPVVAEAAGDVWFKGERFDDGVTTDHKRYPRIPLVPDAALRGLRQFAVKVNGESASAILTDGSYAICVPYWDARQSAMSGDLVLVERRQGGLIEASIRRLRWIARESVWKLLFESDDGRFREAVALGSKVTQDPIRVDGVTTRIVGLVIWKAQPIYQHGLYPDSGRSF